ncbi:subtilisin-like protein [Apiospora arundinis]
MALSSSSVNLFESNQVSLSVSAECTLDFLKDHGFFYQSSAALGQLVDELYETSRARSDDVRLGYFLPTLRQDLRLKAVLDHYPVETRFRFPWGTTGGYYNWNLASDAGAETGLIIYLLGSASQWFCRDGAHKLESDGKLVPNGTYELSDELLEDYPKRVLAMEEGGFLAVHPRTAHRGVTGRSITLGLRTRPV